MSIEPWPADSTKRSRSGQRGSAASNFRKREKRTVAMSAAPRGRPGWPDLACSTASMLRARMALARRACSTGEVTGSFPVRSKPGSDCAFDAACDVGRHSRGGAGLIAGRLCESMERRPACDSPRCRQSLGEIMARSQAMLNAALERLEAAVAGLERAAARRLELEQRRGDLETELSLMQDDRARLAVELDGALARPGRL